MNDEKRNAEKTKVDCNKPHYSEPEPNESLYMTSLSGNRLVPKIHGRIAFRGCIDTLEAEFIEAQVLASQLNEPAICSKLEEILQFLRTLMSAEVMEAPLPPFFLFGIDAEEIRRRSHETAGKSPPLPSYTQGPLAARLNTLRTKVREAELLAVRIFGSRENSSETEPRDDIIQALNRLSSALWWLYCDYTG